MLVDGHLDLAYLGESGRDLTKPTDGRRACVSLPDLRDASVDVVLATIFTEPRSARAKRPAAPCTYAAGDVEAAVAAGWRQLEAYERLEEEGEVAIVRCAGDLDVPARPRLVLLMEGADPIRDAGDLAAWVERGLRLVGLTWAAGTRYAGGNGKNGPLSQAGRELVAALDEAGVTHDASHLADDALDELLERSTGPVVATHSNCRALLDGDDQRHLRDDHIRSIADRGGIIGLNLYTKFVVAGRRATVEDALDHVEHVADVAGSRRVCALGSDMDGGFDRTSLPVGADRPGRLGALGDGLRARGWSDAEVDGFEHDNWLRFLRASLSP